MKLLLQVTNAYYLVYLHRFFKNNKISFTPFWFNPQLHPAQFQQRQMLLCQLYAHLEGLELKSVFTKNALLSFLGKTFSAKSYCQEGITFLLDKTAQFAQKNKYNAFATTLCANSLIDQKMLQKVGKKISEKYKIRFFYKPLSKDKTKIKQAAESMAIAEPRYCGCVVSELESLKSSAQS